MTQIEAGIYIILPKDSINSPAFGIGPVPLIYPPPDMPVRVLQPPFIDNWTIKSAEHNTFTVFAGRGRPDDYKWILKNDTDLFVSTTSPLATSFRIESAGDGLWTIGLPDKDALLTLDADAFPQLIFKSADGSDAQQFQAVRIDRSH